MALLHLAGTSIGRDNPVQLPTKVGSRSEQMEDVIFPSLGPHGAANVHKVPRILFHLSKVGWLECFSAD